MTEFTVSSFEQMGDAPILIFADHASNEIPDDFDDLGLPAEILKTHIAWDIGAGALARSLGKTLGATVLTCGFSRLLADPNRDTTSDKMVPAISDEMLIPGNQSLSKSALQERIDRFHTPYHDSLEAALKDVTARAGAPFVLSVHSFTKRLTGASEDRPWNLGLLWREDEESAQLVARHVEANSSWVVGDNKPYDGALFSYTMDRHVGPRGLRHVTFELRQDMIGDAAGVAAASAILAKTLQHVISRLGA